MCPQPLNPPNQAIAKCRWILQLLAVGCVALCVLGIFANDFFSLIYQVLNIYILFVAWTQFNWCAAMFFFLICTLQGIVAIISIIGITTSDLFFHHQYVLVSIYVLIQIFFYPVAVFFSHYAYKHFKNLAMDGLGVDVPFFNQNNDQGNRNRGEYQRFNDQEHFQAPNASNQDQKKEQKKNKFFQGDGVRIG